MRNGEVAEDDATMLDLVAKRERKGQEVLFVYLTQELSSQLEAYRAHLQKKAEAQLSGAKVKVTKSSIVVKFIQDGLEASGFTKPKPPKK